MEAIVANLNKQYFARSETFMYSYLTAFQAFRPICVSWGPIINRERFPFPAEDCYPLAAPRYSFRWLWRGIRGRLARHHPSPALIASILRERGARLLHAHYGPVGWWALSLHRALSLPLVTTFYGYDVAPRIPDEPPSWPRRRAELFAGGDLFLVEGPHMQKQLLRLGCPPEKIQIQRIAVPVASLSFRPSRPPHGRSIRLLFAGRFVEKKGLLHALEAVSALVREGRKVEFRIVGDGPLAPSVRQFIESRGLEHSVRLLGFLDYRDYLHELHAADVFLHPSVTAADGDTEGGAPTTILEAQAIGLPVVSTLHADIPYVVCPHESALLVPERDTSELVAALTFLIDHPERWTEMGRAGRLHVEAYHDVSHEIIRLEAKYRTLLALHPPPVSHARR